MSEMEVGLKPCEVPPAEPPPHCCPICLKPISQPVALPCSHTFCLGCLEVMGEGLDHHCCPECHTEYGGTQILLETLTIRSTPQAGGTKWKYHQDVSEEIQDETPGGSSTHLEEHGPVKDPQAASESSACNVLTAQEQQCSRSTRSLDRLKFRLASDVTELTFRLEQAEEQLKREELQEQEVSAANSQLREHFSRLLQELLDSSRSYGEQVLQLLEEELHPGEDQISLRISKAAQRVKRLRNAMLRAESLLTEDDQEAFSEEISILHPQIAQLMAEDDQSEGLQLKINPKQVCPKLEQLSSELMEKVQVIQRSIRNAINPSELTFDPDTAHPNLVLSEDLKTVTFSAVAQPYQPSPKRFINFLQVLSSQSFSGGEHCWEVELDGSPWIVGVCYSKNLPRSGLPSALESSRNSWCLMWFENLLRAFEQGHDVPLKQTTGSRRLEIRLSFKTNRLSFFNVSDISGKTHIYTFKARLVEPVHLAYRMMSGQPKARISICP